MCTVCKATKPLTEYYFRVKRGYQSACKPCHFAKNEVARKKRRGTAEYIAYRRRNRLKYWYGLSEEDYEAILEQQGGTCAICRQPDRRKLHVDHDHSCCPSFRSCGKCVRGILCEKCNPALGAFGDDPAVFVRALVYLDTHRKRQAS